MSKRLLSPLLFIFIFLTSVAVYLNTLAPTFSFGDSGELISMISNLGIAHPTGFPIYILLGKIFSLLPLANPGFKINLMSVFFGAITPALLFLALSVYFKKEKNYFFRYFLSTTVSIIFIFSYTLWSQSVMSRIYTLNAAFCAAVLLLFFLYNESEENPKYLFLWALLTGLGAGIHLTFTAFSGILWLHLAFTKFSAVKKNIAWLIFFMVLGLSAYIYLIIRSHSGTPLQWSDINTFKHFFSYITQEQYGMKKFARDLNGSLSFFTYMKDVIFRELSPLAVILFIIGVITSFIQKSKYTFTFLAIFFSSIVMLLFYGNYTDLRLAFRYMIPSYIIMIFFIASLFHSIYIFTKNYTAAAAIAAVLIIAIFTLSFKTNHFESDKHDNYIAYNYASDILTCLPDTKTGLFANGDNNIYPLAYYKFVLHKKPGLSIYDNILTIFKDSQPLFEQSKSNQTSHNVLTAMSLGATSLYTVSEIGSKLFTEIPYGIIFKISDKNAAQDNKYWKMFSLKGITREPAVYHDYEEREIVGTYLYRLSGAYKNIARFPVYEFLLNKAAQEGYDSISVLSAVAFLYSIDPYIENYYIKAEKLYLQSYALNPENFSLVYNIGNFYGRFDKFKDAAYFFEIAGKLNPFDYSVKTYLATSLAAYRLQLDKEQKIEEFTVHFDRGRSLLNQKRFDEALLEFEDDIKANPKLSRSYFHLGLIYSMKSNFDLAIPNYEKAIQLEPQNTPAMGNLGLVYIKLKDYKKAKLYFEKSLAIDPAQNRLKKYVAKLKKMGF